MGHSLPLLNSKLRMPAVQEQTVNRPRLLELLSGGLRRRATFVTAPAGYGKTTLISQWAGQLKEAVGWVTLNERDNDLLLFWKYILEAIERACPGFYPVWSEAEGLRPGNYEPLMIELLNALEDWRQPLVLILDDWHYITDPHIQESVSFFMEYLPPNLHLCFAAAGKPHCPKSNGRPAVGFCS
ncbi:AAA family ATPase [Paenibacillus albidus]|uniref:AAA family ATPase n=1 Tax=Paenibacillus albidus TaxID=2041023 RepID=UPI0020359B6A|nr:AAA family ATPase [Paenibacillus albidus]